MKFMRKIYHENPENFFNFVSSVRHSSVFKYTGLYIDDNGITHSEPVLSDGKEIINPVCNHSALYQCYSDSDKCIKLQDWKGTSTDYVEFTFIDCTFSPASGDVDDSVYIEYRSYTPEEFDSQEFKNKFSLSGNSVNNNVLWLNATRS